MKLTFDEVVDEYHSYDRKEHITETHTVEGDTLEDCFKKAYPYQRSLRYCNGYSIRFRDKNTQEAWNDFLQHGVTLSMYYGNATVD